MVTDGSHFSPTTTSSGYPYITVRDVKEGRIDFENCAFVSNASFDELRRYGCAPSLGDVLFSKDGTVGKVALVGSSQEFVVLSSLAILRPNTSLIDPAYLAYVLMSPAFVEAAIGQKTGVAIRRIILKNLKQIPVPYPSLDEQRRIVAILDEAFEGIATAKAHAEKNLRNAREVFSSEAKSIFMRGAARWPTKTVDQLSTNLDSKRVPITKSDRKAGEFPYYGASGIVDYVADYIFDGDTLLVSEDGANLLARSTPIAFSVSGRYWVK